MTKAPGEITPQQNTPQTPVFEAGVGMWSRGSDDTSGYDHIQRQLFMPSRAEGSFGEPFDTIIAHVRQLMPALTGGLVLFDHGGLIIFAPRKHLREAVRASRDNAHLRFEIYVSVSGVRYPQRTDTELRVVYHLFSITHNRHVRLRVTAPNDDPHVPSVVATYPMASWYEHETWNMFGTLFDSRPSLTRTLIPDD